MTQNAQDLHAALAAVCPILGVSVGDWTNRATWLVDYDPSATSAQKTAATTVISSFDPTKPTNAEIAAAVQAWLDQTARQYQYNDIVSAITYADDATNALWQKQGQYFRTWRAQVWAALFSLQANIAAGTATAPATLTALIAGLPQPSVPTS